jgi:hypothetical protein
MSVPSSFAHGGIVAPSQASIFPQMLPAGDVDTVPARLQPGEMVIPIKLVSMVKSLLHSKKILLPNM